MSLPSTFVKDFHDEASVRKMEYLPLGETGLIVSKISLGTGTLSHLYGNVEEASACRAVISAIKKGINYIDTGYWYGQGRSEEILGLALKSVPRQAYYIATKVGRYELDFDKRFDFSASKVQQNIEESLKRLNVDYIDVIQIHDVEFAPSMDIVLNETLPALEAIKKTGKVRHIGLTGYPLEVLKNGIIGAPGRFEMLLCYTRYSLIDDSLLEYLPFFKEQKLGIVCASGHAMGLLTNGGPQDWHPAHQHVKDKCKEAAAICKDNNVELGRLAMYHFINLDGPSTFLVGMQSEELIDMNLSVYYDGLSEKEVEILNDLKIRVFSTIQQKHWEGVELEHYWSVVKKEK